MRSPRGVPPGSRTATTSSPATHGGRRPASGLACSCPSRRCLRTRRRVRASLGGSGNIRGKRRWTVNCMVSLESVASLRVALYTSTPAGSPFACGVRPRTKPLTRECSTTSTTTPTGDESIDDLVAAYEASADGTGRAFFDSEDLEHVATLLLRARGASAMRSSRRSTGSSSRCTGLVGSLDAAWRAAEPPRAARRGARGVRARARDEPRRLRDARQPRHHARHARPARGGHRGLRPGASVRPALVGRALQPRHRAREARAVRRGRRDAAALRRRGRGTPGGVVRVGLLLRPTWASSTTAWPPTTSRSRSTPTPRTRGTTEASC